MSGVQIEFKSSIKADVTSRFARAVEDSIWRCAEEVAEIARSTVHVRTGRLRASIHVSPPGLDHSGDFDAVGGLAANYGGPVSDMPISPNRTVARMGSDLEVVVGSWIYYASFEEDLHPWLRPAVEASAGTLSAVAAQAFHTSLALGGNSGR